MGNNLNNETLNLLSKIFETVAQNEGMKVGTSSLQYCGEIKIKMNLLQKIIIASVMISDIKLPDLCR